MDKVELYRQVFTAFKELCAQGKQTCSLAAFCREHGVVRDWMPFVLKDEYQNLNTLPGYMNARDVGFVCLDAYNKFKELCAEGKPPTSFYSFYKELGITKRQMDHFMNRNKLKISEIPGASYTSRCKAHQTEEVPFEKFIFEESGFIPADSNDVITVKVDNHVSVNFPADSDITVIVDFLKKIGKEGYHVGA